MKKKDLATLMMTAAGGIALWRFISHSSEKREERENSARDSRAENRLSEEKLKQYLLHLFRLSSDRDKDSFNNGEIDGWKQEAENYAKLLHPYFKRNMETVYKMEGDDGFGNEPFNMTDELFHLPACRIYGEPMEQVYDNFAFEWGQELWMLVDGQFAVADYIKFEKGGWSLTSRIVDKFVKKPDDIPFNFEDLELEFGRILEGMEEDNGTFEKE